MDKFVLKDRMMVRDPGTYWVGTRYVHAYELDRLELERIKLATSLRNAREALDMARTGCSCSVAERASGHHVDCYVPQVREAIELADAALGLPPPVDNDHVAPGCEQFGSAPPKGVE